MVKLETGVQAEFKKGLHLVEDAVADNPLVRTHSKPAEDQLTIGTVAATPADEQAATGAGLPAPPIIGTTVSKVNTPPEEEIKI